MTRTIVRDGRDATRRDRAERGMRMARSHQGDSLFQEENLSPRFIPVKMAVQCPTDWSRRLSTRGELRDDGGAGRLFRR